MTVAERQARLVEALGAIPDVHERLSALVAHGQRLDAVPEVEKTPDRLVPGCVSKVWLLASRDGNGQWHFRRSAGSPLVHGLVGALVGLYEGATSDDILATEPTLLASLRLDAHITPTRLRGLAAVRDTIRSLVGGALPHVSTD